MEYSCYKREGTDDMMVAVCDDEHLFRNELKSFIFSYKAERRLHIDVYEYSTGEALLNSSKAFDIVFLDYQMPGIDGMSVARELRRRNTTCAIIFITSYPHFVFDSFEVQPYRFYVKPIEQSQIVSLMNTFIAHQKLLAPIIVISESEQKIISAKDILYLEGDGKYCIIRTNTDTYSSSKTLAQVHSLLPQHCFYRSHKSYVVNLYSISSFEKGTATLVNGEAVNIGRNKIAEFKQVYKQFIKDYYVKV